MKTMDGHFGITRRQMLLRTACGFGYLALAGICRDALAAGSTPHSLMPKLAHFTPRAKRVIFIFMQGGPSHVDTFDYKPKLEEVHEQEVDILGYRFNNFRRMIKQRMMKSPWSFSRHGESGHYVSELFPHLAKHVDDLCFLHGMHTEGVAHGPATLFLHTGSVNLVRPSMGSWVTYGLGTENQNLPGFVTICPTERMGGPQNYGNAFLPALYQGTAIGRAEQPVRDACIKHIVNTELSGSEQARQFEFLQKLNRTQLRHSPYDDEVASAINSFELAYRMQMNAPELMDISKESPATLKLYGIDEAVTEDFGRQCLLARRMAEADVRYIQINYSDNDGSNPRWDQHRNILEHADHARAVDKPISGLLTDLKARGLLEDTLVWWGGEFGRTPFAENKAGRDHNPNGFTVWLAGAGVKRGIAYGQTDEFGYHAVQDKVHMHDLHATVLHLLGIDHEKLTYRHDGRDFRLTDVYGRVVNEILA